jgi:hypothetical protein
MRICEGCGRAYVPRSGKQRFCAIRCPGRGRAARPRGFVPSTGPSRMPERVCARPGCGVLFQPAVANHVFCSAVCRELARRPLERELYADQKRSRAAWVGMVASGGVRCARRAYCRFADEGGLGGFIRPGQLWDLGHPDAESVGGPEHRECNRSGPSRLRRGMSAGEIEPKLWHSRDW